MLNPMNKRIRTQSESINRELVMLANRHAFWQNQQTRLNLLYQFQRLGVTRSDYIGFQPRIRR